MITFSGEQVEKVADYIAAKILTFEPQLPSYRQSYTVFDVDPEGCEEGDLECISRKADSAHLRRGIPTADNSMSVSISSKKEHPRVLLQSVGNLQEATLQLYVWFAIVLCRFSDGVLDLHRTCSFEQVFERQRYLLTRNSGGRKGYRNFLQ